MTKNIEPTLIDKPINKIRFFFCQYLCAADSIVFRRLFLPLFVILFISFVLFIGYKPTFEIATGYSVRTIRQSIINNQTNETMGIIVEEIMILLCLYSYITIVLWLLPVIYGFYKSNNPNTDATWDNRASKKFCYRITDGFDSVNNRCCYADKNNLDSCSRLLDKCVLSMAYWVSLSLGIYILGIIHIYSWTHGYYDILTWDCTKKVGVCDTDDLTEPNRKLITYFVFELLGLLGIELFLLFVKLIQIFARSICKNLKDNFNKANKSKLDILSKKLQV